MDVQRFFPAEQFGAVRAVARVTDGLSGAAVFSVTTATGDFILRVSSGDRVAWQRSIVMHTLAADAGVAPPVVYIDPREQVSVTVKVTGIALGAAVANPELRSQVMGSLIAQLIALHTIDVHELTGMNDVATLARSVWNVQAQRAGFPIWAAPLADRLPAIAALLQTDERRVVSHCDLNPTNALWDGTRVWFIDWETATLAHPYLDLAIFANFLMLPPEAALGLLAAQERAPIAAHQQAVFAALRDAARLIYGSIFLQLIGDLSTVQFAEREHTLTLLDCYPMLAAGTLNANEPRTQAMLGAAMLKQCDPSPAYASPRS